MIRDKIIVEDNRWVTKQYSNSPFLGRIAGRVVCLEVSKMSLAKCICCEEKFEITDEGWVNNKTGNKEGFCDKCLSDSSKIELLDMGVGQ